MLTVIASGKVSLDDRVRFTNEVIADPALPGACDVVIDVSRILNEPSMDAANAIALLIERLRLRFKGPVALINERQDRLATSAMIAMRADPSGTHVRPFASVELACAWLDGS